MGQLFAPGAAAAPLGKVEMEMVGVICVAAGAEHGLERAACRLLDGLDEPGTTRLCRTMRLDLYACSVVENQRTPIERVGESMFGKLLRAVAGPADIGRHLLDGREVRSEFASRQRCGMLAHEPGRCFGH